MKDLLIQILLDPSSVSFETIIRRLEEFVRTHTRFPDILALFGAVFYVGTLLMRTIVPLRICAIIGDMFFISYGVLAAPLRRFSFTVSCYRSTLSVFIRW